MQFKIIDNERLSIYLTCDELKDCRIDAELLKEPERLKELLLKAGEKSGFSVSDSALEVEIIPILDGDLLVSVKKIERSLFSRVEIAYFDDTEALISACGLLCPFFVGVSDLYHYEGKFYLSIRTDGEDDGVLGILTEFGNVSAAVTNARFNITQYYVLGPA